MEALKKKGASNTVTTCFALFVVLFLLHVTLTSVTNSTMSLELRCWTLKVNHGLSPIQSKPKGPITCDRSHATYDLCTINGPTLFDPSTSSFFTADPTNSTPTLLVKTRPYPRKRDSDAMIRVKEITLTSAPPSTSCGTTHSSPALVFSTGGYTGNFFHEFNEGFLPLFITINSLFPDHSVILVITNYSDWWSRKYAELIRHFTGHPIINMDKETATHCFPSAIVGLISHGPMIVDPTLLPHPKTLLDFHAFLKNALNPGDAPLFQQPSTRPRLILVSRKAGVGRAFLNQSEIEKAAMEVGFEVLVFQPARNTSLVDAYKLIQASHAMLGVHGAGLTHSLFLRPGSVLAQVVPIGVDWLSTTYFEKPAKVLGFQYMEYKIRAEESSLADKYGTNGLVLKNPSTIVRGNWTTMKKLYLKSQNVKLDMARFQIYLLKAYQKAKRFMDIEG